jgi:excisionase family DNA binding protein
MTGQKRDNLLDTKEVSRLLGVSPDTIRKWIKRGKIRARKVEGRWLIERDSLPDMSGTKRDSVQDRDGTAVLFERDSRIAELEDCVRELERDNAVLQERVRELERDKAYLQERIITLERLLESLTPKALPKPPLRERIRRIFKRS